MQTDHPARGLHTAIVKGTLWHITCDNIKCARTWYMDEPEATISTTRYQCPYCGHPAHCMIITSK